MSRKKWNNCFELQWQRRLHATSSREELALPFQSFSQKAKEQEISGRTMRDVRSRMKNELEYQINEKQENSIRLKE